MAASINYSQKISSLLWNAENTTVPSCKLDGYYKTAKLQLKSGLNEEAKETFNKANEVRNVSSYIDTIENVLKLVKLSLLITPDQRPLLLSLAEEKVMRKKLWIQEINGKSVLGNTCAGYFAKLANCFYRLKNNLVADLYLIDAIEWAGKDDPYACLRTYKKIVNVCAVANKKEQFLRVIPSIESKLCKLSVYADAKQAIAWRLDMAKVCCKVDPECGKKMLPIGEKFLDLNYEDLLKSSDFGSYVPNIKFLSR